MSDDDDDAYDPYECYSDSDEIERERGPSSSRRRSGGSEHDRGVVAQLDDDDDDDFEEPRYVNNISPRKKSARKRRSSAQGREPKRRYKEEREPPRNMGWVRIATGLTDAELNPFLEKDANEQREGPRSRLLQRRQDVEKQAGWCKGVHSAALQLLM